MVALEVYTAAVPAAPGVSDFSASYYPHRFCVGPNQKNWPQNASEQRSQPTADIDRFSLGMISAFGDLARKHRQYNPDGHRSEQQNDEDNDGEDV